MAGSQDSSLTTRKLRNVVVSEEASLQRDKQNVGKPNNNSQRRLSCGEDSHQTVVLSEKQLFYPGLIFSRILLPRYMRGMYFALIMMCITIIGQGMIVSGQLTITLPQLEKNFGYSSLQAGIIHSVYDIAFGVSALIVGFFGQKRKMFVIGWGAIIMAAGCGIFTIPHFLKNVAVYTNTNYADNSFDSNVCSKDSLGVKSNPYIEGRYKMVYLFVFSLGYALIGIGAAPMHTIGITYFDEHLSPQMSGCFLGVYYLFGALGPALGFGLGNLFLKYPANPNDSKSSSNYQSETWIGAWWIGYIIGSIILLISGTILILYPSRKSPFTKTSAGERTQIEDSAQKPKSSSIIRYFKSLLTVCRNVPFILLVIGLSLEGLTINGIGTFLSKLLEVQFHVTAGTSSLLAGILCVLGAGMGAIIGGTAIKYIRCTRKTKALGIFIISFLTVGFFCGFLVGCNQIKLQNVQYDSETRIVRDLDEGPNECKCKSKLYNPVCYEDVTSKNILKFYNPCKAGCSTTIKNSNGQVSMECSYSTEYKNETLSYKDETLSYGGCKDSSCNKLPYYMILIFFALFLTFVIYVPEITLMLQYLDDSQKNAGISVQQTSARVFFIIGPIVIGHVIDAVCEIWSQDEFSEKAANCVQYNNWSLVRNVSITAVVIKLVSTMFYLGAYLFSPRENSNNSTKEAATTQSFDN